MKSKEYNQSISTGSIAAQINSLHRKGVLREMRRRYLNETEKFFQTDEQENKIVKSDYAADVSCPICDSDCSQSEFVVQVHGFDHRRCFTCKNIYVTPRLKDEYIWEQYSRPSYTYMFKHLIEDTLDFRKDVIARGKFNWVTKRLKNPNAKSILDIGSGLGENLVFYKEHGWDTFGIEFNEYAAEKSREKFDLTVINEPIERAKLPRSTFDVITLWGVLEHLTEPVKVLRETMKYLADDGVLIFMVPNFECLLAQYLVDYPLDADRILDGDKHIVLFTRGGIDYLIKLLNLKLVDLKTSGLDLVTILGYLDDEKDSRLHKFVSKQLSNIQEGIEKVGMGDHFWVMVSKT